MHFNDSKKRDICKQQTVILKLTAMHWMHLCSRYVFINTWMCIIQGLHCMLKYAICLFRHTQEDILLHCVQNRRGAMLTFLCNGCMQDESNNPIFQWHKQYKIAAT